MGKIQGVKKELQEKTQEKVKKDARLAAEEAILGLLLSHEIKIKEVDENLFLTIKNKEIFNALSFVSEHTEVFSAENVGITLANRFKNKEWQEEIKNLQEQHKSGNKDDIDVYLKILEEENIKIKANKIISNIQTEIQKGNLQVIKHAAKELQNIDLFEKSYSIEMDEAVGNSLFRLRENAKSETGFAGVRTGIETLDEITGGFQKKDLIVIAARPGQGKTSSVINFLNNNDLDHAGFITSEMPYEQLIYRLLALKTRINAQKFRSPKYLTEEDFKLIEQYSEELKNKHLFINDRAKISMSEIAEQARIWKEEKDIKILYIDYLQRIRYTGKGHQTMNRSERVGMVAQESKELAKELEIPVVQLAQLNRDTEKNGERRTPTMADLKDSGMIEQEADLIAYLHRDFTLEVEMPIEEDLEFGLLKNRHGPVGIIPCRWIAQLMEIKEKIELELPY